jgi:hypothetical protein
VVYPVSNVDEDVDTEDESSIIRIITVMMLSESKFDAARRFTSADPRCFGPSSLISEFARSRVDHGVYHVL